jgi:hypothetical protein
LTVSPNLTDPFVESNLSEIMLKSVVFPAPLAPMTPNYRTFGT